MAQIDQFLRVLVEQGGSDLHLTTGSPPVMRVHGHMQKVKFRDLSPKDMEALVYEIMEEEWRMRFLEKLDYDFAYELLGKDGIPEKDGHAGFVETSRVLAVAPRLVKGHARVKPDWPSFNRHEILGRPETKWKTGVQGDPRKASAAVGRKVDAYVLKRTLELIDEVFAAL